MIKSHFKGIEKEIISSINLSKERVIVAVAWFTNHKLFEALCNKLNEGKEVKLCLINDQINNREDGINFERFIEIGGQLYFGNDNELMHHKFCIIDNDILFNGSYNWTYYAENRNRENIIKFNGYTELVSDFLSEFHSTVNSCDKVLNYRKYIEANPPVYSQELSKYLSYDLMYQAKQENNQGNYIRAKSTISKAIVKNSINAEAKVEQTKIEVKLASSPKNSNVSETVTSFDTNKIDYSSVLRKHEQEIFNNYISDNPNRQKAYEHAKAIYDYERENDFKYVSSYNPVTPGYIMMIFGKYNIAKEFFKRTQTALGYYDLGVLSLLMNDKVEFNKNINNALVKLGQNDQPCSALYKPKLVGGMIQYIENKQNNMSSIDTISLKQTILDIKREFKI
jgi:hypothetical protein